MIRQCPALQYYLLSSLIMSQLRYSLFVIHCRKESPKGGHYLTIILPTPLHLSKNFVFRRVDIQAPPEGGPFKVLQVRGLLLLGSKISDNSAQLARFSGLFISVVRAWSVHGVQDPWAAQEGTIELLLAKVKNASGRIGIFCSYVPPSR